MFYFNQFVLQLVSATIIGEIAKSISETFKKYKLLGSTPRDAKSVKLEWRPEVSTSFILLRKVALL